MVTKKNEIFEHTRHDKQKKTGESHKTLGMASKKTGLGKIG